MIAELVFLWAWTYGLGTGMHRPLSASRVPFKQSEITFATNSGERVRSCGRTFSLKFERSIGVSTAPRLTPKTLTPMPSPSFAALLVMESSALFDAAYAKKPANGSVVPIVDTLTMRPDFWVLK